MEATKQVKPTYEISITDFNEFKAIIYAQSGITLDDDKEYLLTSRLEPRLKELKMETFGEYLKFIKSSAGKNESTSMLDAICTNVTSFFREPQHFEFIASSIQKIRQTQSRQINIWSAACSSGEEPYSLAMRLAQAGLTKSNPIQIYASDLSMGILDKAKKGVYEKSILNALPSEIRESYFQSINNSKPEKYAVVDSIKSMVQFSRINLSNPPFNIPIGLDFIMIRNVLIYFDAFIRKKILQECYRLLNPGGLLIVGLGEGAMEMFHGFKIIKPSIFKKPD